MWENISRIEVMAQVYIVFGSNKKLIKFMRNTLVSGNQVLIMDMELLKEKGNLNILGSLQMIKYAIMI